MQKLKYLGVMMFALITSFTFAQKSKTFKVNIKPNTVSCTGVVPQECMQVKFCNEKEYQLFYDKIEGFSYEKGFEYKLKVKRTEVINPPADGSKYKYVLKKVVSKKAVKVNTFENKKLYLTKLNGKVIDNKKAHLTIDTNTNSLFGSGSCNRFNIGLKVNKDIYQTSSGMSTMMACDSESMSLEAELLNAIQDKKFKITQTGNIITFTDQASKNVIEFSIPTANETLAYLAKNKWKLVMVENVGMDYGKASISFNVNEKRVNGSTGCNNFFGGYMIQDDKISFTQIGMTRMACLDEDKKKTENKLVEVLNSKDLRFDIADQTFNIYKDNKIALIFAKTDE